jgi:hypothetical protein
VFDPTAARARLNRLWELKSHFGLEGGRNRIFLDEIVSDRLQLIAGLQVLRDELLFAHPASNVDRDACGADFSLPSVVPTLAYTNCGDRIHQDANESYRQTVASRFATITEVGALKAEAFSPTGGGTDDGATLAHVTIAHQLDDRLRRAIYAGNLQSFVMAAFDLRTHVGRLETPDGLVFGKGRESPWRQPRAACGAIVGTLANFNESNDVHLRIRNDLGAENFAFLRDHGVRTREGVDITAVVGAAIVATHGLLETAHALTREMDERGLAHLTASVTVNRPSMPDTILYLTRATVFSGEITMQGFGVDATRFSGEIIEHQGDGRLRLLYDGKDGGEMPASTERYAVRQSSLTSDPYA